jgi:Terminase large subunit, T4likevirus-type, N-terminal
MATIASDLALALDPARLAERVGMTPDPWQADLLRSSGRQLILNCARQSGKSTVSSLLALHAALYRPPALVLLLSPSLRQSQELFRKVKDALQVLGADAPPLAEESALRLEWTNGSRVVCLPGKEQTIRGFSGVGLLVVDEASRVPDELYQAIRPMIAVSGGRIVLLSTPFGRRGFFFEAWEHGGGAWERTRITADACTRIPAAWLAEERATIGAWWFEQEYLCAFRDTLDQVFSYDDVMAAVSPEVRPLFGGS